MGINIVAGFDILKFIPLLINVVIYHTGYVKCFIDGSIEMHIHRYICIFSNKFYKATGLCENSKYLAILQVFRNYFHLLYK